MYIVHISTYNEKTRSDWVVSGEVEIDWITVLRITAISKFVPKIRLSEDKI